MVMFARRVVALLAALSLRQVLAEEDYLEEEYAEEEDEGERIDDSNAGPHDRFWRHHAVTKTLIYEGVDHYDDIQNCFDAAFTDEERHAITTQSAEGTRQVGRMIAEDHDEDEVFLVQIQKAILPIHVKAIQTLAACARKSLPHIYESRPMYQEWNLDEDPGLGGNCPTHLVPLVGIFLPSVLEQMQQTLEFAYEAAGWEDMVDRDRVRLYFKQVTRERAMHAPDRVGFRASEHLTYNDFPSLADHTDGDGTVYTMNYAFSDAYEGGEFYIWANGDSFTEETPKYAIKPQKYDCLVFLGGKYTHGVQEITGGKR